MVKQAAENPVNPTTLPNLNLVTRIYFVQNSLDVTADYLTADFMMRMLGYVCHKIRKGNMTGLNMKMEQGLDVKDNVQVKTFLKQSKVACKSFNNFQFSDKIKVDSWWRWLFWHCSYCFCKCDAPGPNSDRYWSLKPALVDVSANKILTGLRFVKKNRIIQVEVQQSSPLPEGVINETDRSWIQNSSEITLDDKDDIFEMSYEERSLDLDVLEAPKGHVVTGLRFRKLGSHINLEARVTDYFPV